LTCGSEGPSETCAIHGRAYAEWVERGDILNARIEAVKEVIAKVRRTPAKNDPYRVALEIADDLEAAVYLEPGTWPSDHGAVQSIEELRAALMSPSPKPFFPDSPECCASGRCEVCSPGFDWGRDG
jgi:hypothetical protein